MRTIVASALLLLLGIAAASAQGVFHCRAAGVFAEQGETLCIPTPEGVRRARCGMALNVSSWTFLDEPCPAAPTQADDGAEAGAPAPSQNSPSNRPEPQ